MVLRLDGPYSKMLLGSLRNHDGDAENNIDQKMNLYFTFESHDTLKSFVLFITVKTIAILNPELSDIFKKENQKLAVVVHHTDLLDTSTLVALRWSLLPNFIP